MIQTTGPLLKGKYVFFGIPEQNPGFQLMAPSFAINALFISDAKGSVGGKVQPFEVTNLISKMSVYTDSTQSIEAHKLYTWPAKLGDPAAWAESKRLFFTQHLIHYPIEILAELEGHHVSWKYISPEDFINSASKLNADPEFQALLAVTPLLQK